jgi:hypothetical protein
MIRNIYNYFLIWRSGLFDRHYYLLENPDVRKADMDPLWHFVKIGWKEGRNPSENFDISKYLENNEDLRSMNLNPLVHYIIHRNTEESFHNS